MASEAPSAKRPRCDDFAEPNEISKSRFWFDDGNIILQAENTQYKVHRSLLANQSVVFRDMFSMPQPANPDPVVDACPVVPLSDKAADIEHVLSLFYDNFKAHDMREHMPFPLLAAILRIGKKYQIDHLQNEGLHRLRKEFPTDFAYWNENCVEVVAIKSLGDHLEAIINLAHELSVQSILPALYICYLSAVKMDDILYGTKDIDGVSIRLNEEAARQCLKGRNRLILELFNLTKKWFSTPGIIPSPSCERIMLSLLW
ncbi:hypothetical protein CVT26_013319 [Gymnopilus dilepis]|uniref:BTB domain-containing protein n=1 Tax=Gymnopilus dilepis TaxID=231916 RepID=A0A409WV46_9AGAR|nr:hypothetical protein CVT26_013319 [Gymnopilus dilepis]